VEPSWGKVLATTIKVWVLWRLRRGPQGRPTAMRWRVAALAVALVAITAAALQFAGVFTGTATAARAHAEASPVARHPARHVTPSPAALAQAQAAAWIASQVSAAAIVACDPVMCAALQAQGVTAGRLMPLQAGPSDPHGATVVATATPASPQLAGQYAPAVIASFGSGNARIEVRATEPGGAAGYASALRADLAARKSAGSQLLHNSRLQFTAQDATRLLAGEVDSRLLATLAALSSQSPIQVTAFGDSSPGAAVLFRSVTIASRDGAAGLAAALAMVNQQRPPYLPAQAAIIHLATGRAALQIRFAAPGPLGLLSAVLTADSRTA
jgi:hypothetical protein